MIEKKETVACMTFANENRRSEGEIYCDTFHFDGNKLKTRHNFDVANFPS